MKISELIKEGHVKDTKEGYVVNINSIPLDLTGEVNKPLIFPNLYCKKHHTHIKECMQ